jgi:hypothetical protein
MLVAFSTLVTANLDPVALSALFQQGLAIAGTPDAGLVGVLVGRDVVAVVIDGTLVQLGVDHGLVCVGGQTRGRRRQAAHDRGSRSGRLGRALASGGIRNGHGRGVSVTKGGGNGSDVGSGICDRLAAGDTVSSVEGASRQQRMGVVAGV